MINSDMIKDRASILINTFVKRVMPVEWCPRGILVSEGFAFCVIADLYNVEIIIESGTYDGRSTEILGKYFSEIPIYTIEKDPRKGLIEKFKKYPNINIVKGNSFELLPSLLSSYKNNKIAIFIDGPKGKTAVQLANKCLNYSNVKFSSVHDVHKKSFGKTNETRVVMDLLTREKFYTDSQWFVDSYSFLDKDESQEDEGQDGMKWEPYKKTFSDGKELDIGSYGPTIGFIFKNG
jgi:hypothetical protein